MGQLLSVVLDGLFGLFAGRDRRGGDELMGLIITIPIGIGLAVAAGARVVFIHEPPGVLVYVIGAAGVGLLAAAAWMMGRVKRKG